MGRIQIEDNTYEALRVATHRQRKPISALATDILREHLATRLRAEGSTETELKRKYPFIGMGQSGETDLSVRHDDYLAEDFL